MAVTTKEFGTLRGDVVKVTLFEHCGEPPSILVTLIDADDTVPPTAEFTIGEAAEVREVLRKFCEQAQRGQRFPSS